MMKRHSNFRISCTIFVSVIALLGSATSVYANTDLKSSLLNMGYEGIRIEACKLKFARRITPKVENNDSFAYERFIDLSTLKEFSDAKIEKIKFGKVTFYILDSEFGDEYYELYRNVLFFKSFARKNYPNSNWPYKHSKFHDEFVTVLEFEMRQNIPMFQLMNRWIYYTKFGASTFFTNGFDIISDNSESLKKFQQALIDYSIKNNCNSSKITSGEMVNPRRLDSLDYNDLLGMTDSEIQREIDRAKQFLAQ